MPEVGIRGALLFNSWKFEDAAFADFQTAVQASTWQHTYASGFNPSQLIDVTATVTVGSGGVGAVVDFSSGDARYNVTLVMNDGDYLVNYQGGNTIAVSAVAAADFQSQYFILDSDN